MKTTFLTNLLVVFAVGLCGLCTFQWFRETQSRQHNQALHDQNYRLELTIQDHTNRIAKMDLQIADLTDRTAELGLTLKSNEATIKEIRKDNADLISTNDYLARVLDAYTNAFNETTNRLALAYEDIKKQNDIIKDVIAERDSYVLKLNDAISNRNQVVQEFNDLVERVTKMQEAQEAAQQQKK